MTENREKTKEFFDYAKKMMQNSKMNEDTVITPENIYQQAYTKNRPTLLEIMRLGHLPGSTENWDNLQKRGNHV